MREKKPALIITFPSTAAAMEAESFCLEQGLPGRIIPVPREITAGCGLAWRAPPEAETLLTGALGTAGLAWSDARVLEV
ncbi:MAG: DUF3343 domain-containing protein [Oscillospiraceae bacterium]|jgi:hypothetical protein|nr:DUF3343 domain-containing protein [Oscillospiraceae bacterium]MCI9563954.1 DUF3343 domain-containing protein [Oscillospiraceae bacterium]